MQVAKYLGKPYKDGGLGPKAFDCYGLALSIRKDEGLFFPEHTMGNHRNNESMLNLSKFKAEKLTDPQPYSIVTFRPTGRFITHIGIVMENCYQFIHVIKNQLVCVERLDSVLWRSKLEGYYEFPSC